MEISTSQLKVFVVVAERGNFTRAAEELFMAQPSVSAVIGRLEQTVGLQLFDQIGKRIHLTEAGETMLVYARRILALVEEAEGALGEFQEAGSGRLLMGASNTIGIYVLPHVLRSFRALYPEVSVAIEIGNTSQVVSGVQCNRLDFGLVAGHPEHPDLKIGHFLTDRLVLIVPAEHPLAKEPSLSVADLAREPFIIRERGATTRAVVEQEMSRLGVQLNVTMEVGDNEAVKQAVAAGLGVSILSEFTIATELALGRIAQLQIAGAHFRRDFYLLWHKDKYRTKTVRQFLDYLTTVVADSPYVSAKE
ncbi:MAG: LysR family transcriptional regulator [Chloroflexota bacterium]